MAKKTKLSGKSPAELEKMLKEKREELRGLRFSAAGARPKDSNAPKKTRREIARILTHQHAEKGAARQDASASV